MAKVKIGFDNWPFDKGEVARLIKVSKPYLVQGSWHVDAVYLSLLTNKVKHHEHLFGDLHLLIWGAEYVNGKRSSMSNWIDIDVDITQKNFCHKKPEPYLNKDKINQEQFDYYTFGIPHKGKYYIIPLHEILRAVLAPDIFWLNQVILLDSINTRIMYSSYVDYSEVVFLDVPLKYVNSDQKIKHAVWIFSNLPVYEMINQAYKNIQNGYGLKFDFLFDEFYFKAKAEVKETNVYVKEIVFFGRKRINCKELSVHHAGFIEYEKKSTEKKKKWIAIAQDDGDKKLSSDDTATPGVVDVNEDDAIQAEYCSFVNIKRIKKKKTAGEKTTTKTRAVKNGEKAKRTTGDFGGLDTVPQIEFEYLISEKLKGLFADICAILSILSNRKEVASIEYHVGGLNRHFRFRAICTLEDGVTPRRYIVAKIRLINGKEAVLIEIERENLSLTTLMVASSLSQKWNVVCHKIIKGLILKSGSWPDFNDLDFEQLEYHRFKHTNVEISKREQRMFEFLNV